MGHLQKTFETAVSDINEAVKKLRDRSQISNAAVGVTLEIDVDKSNIGMIELPQDALLGVKATFTLEIPAVRKNSGFQPGNQGREAS